MNCEGTAPPATLCPSPSLLPIPSVCYSLKPLTKREWVQKAFSWHLRATGQGLSSVSSSGALLALSGWVQAELIRPCLSCLGLKPGGCGGSLGPAGAVAGVDEDPGEEGPPWGGPRPQCPPCPVQYLLLNYCPGGRHWAGPRVFIAVHSVCL